MEIAHVGVTTRARAALSMATPEATSPEPSPKRRKINNNTNQHLDFSSSSPFHSTSNGAGNDVVKPEIVERCSDESSSASCCSSNRSFELDQHTIKFLDLEVHTAQVETSTCNEIREEMNVEREHGTNSQEVDSSEKIAKKTKSRCVLSKMRKIPTDSELEQFFADAEKDINKRFSDKYNYDFVKDVPLEGRYEWVPLKP